MNSRRITFGLAASAMLLAPAIAAGGGLMRPNPVSARSVGLGGAFSAVADDPTALHFNPAGLAHLPGSNLLLGAELVVAPRTYEPRFADGRCDVDPAPAECQTQSPTAPPRPLPSLGFATRLSRDGVPSRVTFGVGIWNTFGGQLEYNDEPAIPRSVVETRNAVIEVVPGFAYEVNDVLSVGLALRLGVGLFDTTSFMRPSNADFSAKGIGVGATVGVMVRPSRKLSVGYYYRSPLTVTTKGGGQLDGRDTDISFVQNWPQQMGLGVAYRPSPKLLISTQVDWHGWQRINDIGPEIEGSPDLSRFANIHADWDDNYAFHAGIQYDLNPRFQARGGFTYDTRAINTRTQERQFLDSDKMLGAVGASYRVSRRVRIDAAFESTIPRGVATIEDNSGQVSAAGWGTSNGGLPGMANAAPGDHSGMLYTLELAAQILF